MVDVDGQLPSDMRRFIHTPAAKPLVSGRNLAFLGSLAIAGILYIVLRQFAVDTVLSVVFAGLTLALNATVLMLQFRAHASTPLAVNMNHPFMDSEPLGDAKVLVRLLDGRWVDPGPHRVRTVPEDLLGGFNLVQDTDDFPVLGHFVAKPDNSGTMVRHLALINQAIALRDAVNEVPDPIETAREREKLETGLLERSWLEDEENVEVESPLVSFLREKNDGFRLILTPMFKTGIHDRPSCLPVKLGCQRWKPWHPTSRKPCWGHPSLAASLNSLCG